jgi:hypothetical protein
MRWAQSMKKDQWTKQCGLSLPYHSLDLDVCMKSSRWNWSWCMYEIITMEIKHVVKPYRLDVKKNELSPVRNCMYCTCTRLSFVILMDRSARCKNICNYTHLPYTNFNTKVGLPFVCGQLCAKGFKFWKRRCMKLVTCARTSILTWYRVYSAACHLWIDFSLPSCFILFKTT